MKLLGWLFNLSSKCYENRTMSPFYPAIKGSSLNLNKQHLFLNLHCMSGNMVQMPGNWHWKNHCSCVVFTVRFSKKKCPSRMHSLRIIAELKKQALHEKKWRQEKIPVQRSYNHPLMVPWLGEDQELELIVFFQPH